MDFEQLLGILDQSDTVGFYYTNQFTLVLYFTFCAVTHLICNQVGQISFNLVS